jgi:adenylate kinase family enzyme
MISLIKILNEALGKPKAIILAGAPGAGKGYILRGLDLSGLTTYNLDLDFVPLLKKAGVSLDLKNSTPEERSQAAKLMRQATSKLKDEDLPKAIANRESFILDGTAASSKATLKLKDELEKAGYEVFMLYVYTDLERSLKQNQDRFDKSGGEDRSLAPAIVMRTWNDVTQNYDTYKNAFGGNFVSVSNLLKDEKLDNLEDIVDKYLKPYKPQGTKPKDAKAQARSDKKKLEINTQIKSLLADDGVKNVIDNSVSAEEAQSALKTFLNK